MSRELNEEQSGKLKSAVKAVVDAAEGMKGTPRFSAQADAFKDQVLQTANVGRKILSQLGGDREDGTPDTPPNLPDSGRGDFDTKGQRGSVPQGLTSTSSMKGERGRSAEHASARGQEMREQHSNRDGDKHRGLQSDGNDRRSDLAALGKDPKAGINEDGTQTFGGENPPARRESIVPGLSGHPVKKDDRERAGNEYNVDSTTHRAAAAGETTNADTLEGGRKALEEGGGDSQMRRETEPGTDGNPANISNPFKSGMDTTNTSSEGSGKPDNYFAKNAPKADTSSTDQTDGSNGEGKTALKKAADEPKKYDSENRVATETLGHLAEKERRAREGGGDMGTSRNPNDPFNSDNKSAVEKSAADKQQEQHQGDQAAKSNTDKPQTPAHKPDAEKADSLKSDAEKGEKSRDAKR